MQSHPIVWLLPCLFVPCACRDNPTASKANLERELGQLCELVPKATAEVAWDKKLESALRAWSKTGPTREASAIIGAGDEAPAAERWATIQAAAKRRDVAFDCPDLERLYTAWAEAVAAGKDADAFCAAVPGEGDPAARLEAAMKAMASRKVTPRFARLLKALRSGDLEARCARLKGARDAFHIWGLDCARELCR